MTEKEITIEIRKPELVVLLAFAIFILVIELQVTLKFPIVFGDESFHTRLAQNIAENIELPITFGGTKLTFWGVSRPPMVNILIGSLFFIFGTNFDIPVRFLIPFITFFICISVFLLSKKLFDEKIGLVAAMLTISAPSIVTYSVLVYTDLAYTLYASMFFLLLAISIKTNNKKYFILSSIFGGIAVLTDISGLSIPVFLAFILLYEAYKTRNLILTIKKYITAFIIILIVIGGFLIRNIYYFKSPICYNIPFLNFFDTSKCSFNLFEPKYQFSARTEAVATEQSVYSMGFTNYLSFAYGNLFLIVFGFLVGLILLLFRRDIITNMIVLYLLLFVFLFYLSIGRAEDTPRTTLAWTPVFALVSSVFFGEVYNFIKTNFKYLALIVFLIVILISYQNFKEKLDIMRAVKQFSPAFFEACNWVKENTDKNATLYTVWAWRALYNCQRNAAGLGTIPDIALSMNDTYIAEIAKQHGITHIFIQKFSIDPQNRHYSENYDLAFVQFLEDHPNTFVRVYENGVNFDMTNRNVANWVNYCYQRFGTLCDGNVIYEIKTTGV